MNGRTLSLLPALILTCSLWGLGGPEMIDFVSTAERMALVEDGRVVPVWLDQTEDTAVQLAVESFRGDLERVTGRKPGLVESLSGHEGDAILVGTLDNGGVVDLLVNEGKLTDLGLAGRWEGFQIEVVENPLPGIERALVVAGSDRRGTIYGLYSLSEQMGVSPWYWWADVPVEERTAVYVNEGPFLEAPSVRYRGIFLNDEAPALSGWAGEKFGGFNHRFYEKVFELILRLRGNYLWPAMWGNAFADDDPLNPVRAHEYGIVVGTSHHEPLMRAHAEWSRYGEGPWNYAENAEELREFWRGGLERVKDYEKIITIGMRGDGDEAMSEETNIALLERIVADQRDIISDVLERPAEEVPQIWALYKEVQEYYQRGMRVPDDVTLLWCDDNWGNIRRLPLPAERQRPGGAGVYYHFDYVGGPRNYKWINVTPIRKVWEQMHLAWEYEADRIWIVNVGDLKPMEFPIEFFLTYAWDPERWPYERLDDYSRQWAAREFGEAHAASVAALINGYSRMNRRRTPELMSPDTLSLIHYGEAERVLAEWKSLVDEALRLEAELPAAYQDAYYQLVLYPVLASANLHAMYVSAGYNQLYAMQGRTATNSMADKVIEFFQRDQELAGHYHRLGGGKWNHMMDQINIGYRIWQQPNTETMPAVHRVRPFAGPSMGIAIEGAAGSWPSTYPPDAVLPPLDVYTGGSRWIDVFNRGTGTFDFSSQASVPWVRVEPPSGVVDEQTRVEVSVDWEQVPLDPKPAVVTLSGPGFRQAIEVPVINPASPRPADLDMPVELGGYLAIDATDFSRAVAADPFQWKVLPKLGRTSGSVTMFPVDTPAIAINESSPRLEYDLYLRNPGDFLIELHLGPSLDFQEGEGLRFGLSLDDQAPVLHKVDTWETLQTWEKAVGDSVRRIHIPIRIDSPGRHTLKLWHVTPGVLFQRILIDTGDLRPSYLGPPSQRPKSFSQASPSTLP